MRVASSLLVSALLLTAAAGVSRAGDADPFEQPVKGRAHALPDGAGTASPDDLSTGSADPDSRVRDAGNPDARVTDSGEAVPAHSADSDSQTARSADVSDLPSASSIDDIPASISPAPSAPAACTRPAGDAGWSACLAAVQAQLDAAQERLADAEGAYSRSITRDVPRGEARLEIIQSRDAARSDVAALSAMLAEQAERARAAGASSRVTDPYASQTDGG